MNTARRQQHEQAGYVPGWLMALIMFGLGAVLCYAVFGAPSGLAQPVAVPTAQPLHVDVAITMQGSYQDPTAPTQTPVVVVVTAVPTKPAAPPFCHEVELGETCSMSPNLVVRPYATQTPESCEVMRQTPAAYIRICRKTDEAGASAEVQAK